MWRIGRFFRWLKWLKDGKPRTDYPGFHCGLCGAWTEQEFSVPEYLSNGEWWDTWKVCPEGCFDEHPDVWGAVFEIADAILEH
jgi:hypothetical protein